MNPEQLLILIFGMVAGGVLGYLTAWRMARKLEAHQVKLWQWDRKFDMQAQMAEIIPFDRQSQK